MLFLGCFFAQKIDLAGESFEPQVSADFGCDLFLADGGLEFFASRPQESSRRVQNITRQFSDAWISRRYLNQSTPHPHPLGDDLHRDMCVACAGLSDKMCEGGLSPDNC